MRYPHICGKTIVEGGGLQNQNGAVRQKEKESDPDWIRTNDLQLRRLPLYPTELRDLDIFKECKDNFF